MVEPWQIPAERPLFTDALLMEQYKAYRSESRKDKAYNTPFRYSDSGGCARAMVYGALGVEPTDTMDVASVHVTNMGTLYHEQLQEALSRKYPGATFETPTMVEHTSGHSDGIVPEVSVTGVARNWEGGSVSLEFKFLGSYPFEKAVGVSKRGYTKKDPEGPRFKDMLQCGMNAYANGCETCVIGYIARDPISTALATKVLLPPIQQVVAEFTIPQTVWWPLVDMELNRQANLVTDYVEHSLIPPGEVYNDEGTKLKRIHADGSHWLCKNYCLYRSVCLEDGPNEVAVDIRKVS